MFFALRVQRPLALERPYGIARDALQKRSGTRVVHMFGMQAILFFQVGPTRSKSRRVGRLHASGRFRAKSDQSGDKARKRPKLTIWGAVVADGDWMEVGQFGPHRASHRANFLRFRLNCGLQRGGERIKGRIRRHLAQAASAAAGPSSLKRRFLRRVRRRTPRAGKARAPSTRAPSHTQPKRQQPQPCRVSSFW